MFRRVQLVVYCPTTLPVINHFYVALWAYSDGYIVGAGEERFCCLESIGNLPHWSAVVLVCASAALVIVGVYNHDIEGVDVRFWLIFVGRRFCDGRSRGYAHGGYHRGRGSSSSHVDDGGCGRRYIKVTGGCVGPCGSENDVMFVPCDGQQHFPHGSEWLRPLWFWRVSK